MNRTQNQDSPCPLCARLAEEHEFLKKQMELAIEVIDQQLGHIDELRAAVDSDTIHLNDFGFRN